MCVYVYSCVSYWTTGLGEGNNLIANNVSMCVYVYSCVSYGETGLGEGNNVIANNVCAFQCVSLRKWSKRSK